MSVHSNMPEEAARIDPLREEAVRDVMRLFTAVGQPSAALQHYTEFVRLVLDTFQSTPSARNAAILRSEYLMPWGTPPRSGTAFSPHMLRTSLPQILRDLTKQQRIRLPQTRFFGREL